MDSVGEEQRQLSAVEEAPCHYLKYGRHRACVQTSRHGELLWWIMVDLVLRRHEEEEEGQYRDQVVSRGLGIQPRSLRGLAAQNREESQDSSKGRGWKLSGRCEAQEGRAWPYCLEAEIRGLGIMPCSLGKPSYPVAPLSQ